MHETTPEQARPASVPVAARWLHGLTFGVFLAVLATPGLLGALQADAGVSAAENRRLAPRPTLHGVADLRGFPEAADAWFRDHFAGREALTRVYRTAIFDLGDSPSDNVFRGRDGWLFLGSLRQGSNASDGVVDDARHRDRYPSRKLGEAVKRLEARRAWLAERGIAYVLVLAPDKHTVYPDKLPRWFDQVHPESAADQLVAALREQTTVEVVDLRPVLAAARLHGQVYFQRDSHWNATGAAAAAGAVADAIRRVLPGWRGLDPYTLVEGPPRVGDLTRTLGVGLPAEPASMPSFPEGVPRPVRTPAEGLDKLPHAFATEGRTGTALIFRDSFFEWLEPHVVRLFGRTVHRSLQPSDQRLQQECGAEPFDVVIEQWVERKLPWVPPAGGDG